MVVDKHSNSNYIGHPNTITILKPAIETELRQFFTNIGHDQTGSESTRIGIVLHEKSPVTTLMANIVSRYEINLAKQISRCSHENDSEMIKQLQDVGKPTPPLALVLPAWDACNGSGRRGIKKKISLSHINQAFNEEVHVDFATVRNNVKYELRNVVGTGKKYDQRLVGSERSTKTLKMIMERHWFYEFGSPQCFSGHLEFMSSVMESFIKLQNVTVHQWRAWSSNKNGITESQKGVLKVIMESSSKHDHTSDVEEVVARASFLTNFIKPSIDLSRFQLEKG